MQLNLILQTLKRGRCRSASHGTAVLACLAGGGRPIAMATASTAALLLGACEHLSVAERNQSIAGLAVLTAAITPSAEVEQTYYLGSFDPRSQLPPAVYRIRVRGQSSLLNDVRFASSWVPSEVVDALTGTLSIDTKSGALGVNSDAATKSSLATAGRGLVVFGPEGFREAPRGHRLVIIMGASPETVEQAFASALGTVAQVKFGQSTSVLDRDLFTHLLDLSKEREQLKSIAAER